MASLYLKFDNGIPRRHCIANIIKVLDSDSLLQAVFGWINDNRQSESKTIIALDGKTMRGASREDAKSALHLFSAFMLAMGLRFTKAVRTPKVKKLKSFGT